MRYPPDHKQRTRVRILDAAARAFRRQGYHAAGVDGVMEEAGLTAGGFYAHFASKQELLAEALTYASKAVEPLREAGLEGLSGRAWIDVFLDRYLSMGHCLKAEDGCPLVAMVSEVARADAPVKKRFESMVVELCDQLEANAYGSGQGTGTARERSMAAMALCVGGLGLARAVHDEALAERILASCRTQARALLYGAADAAEAE